MDTGEAGGGTGTIQEGKAARYALAALMKKTMMPVKKGIDENNHWVGLRSIAGGSDEDVIKKLPER
ncbi:hypothetical protein [Parageobacillus thermoglucosidasius]|uniref:Uncharacterized protein n=1 Tax=Parageobacillus thermoglucosidasius TaxID=1426 RepID=A0AB38QW95_PARTM|nr:hypothetical protein [Parageobacillus thermoglucosidasius]UOE76091.1 hypothetical protein IMI45_17800 [Parageobacillus thermoglucosidasius]